MANQENKGALFNNEDNKTSANAPDYSGSINIGGVEYKLAGWIKEGQGGKKGFLSLNATVVGEGRAPQGKPAYQAPQTTGYKPVAGGSRF